MGGDLNLKKSWHPNLMKNQERVWKAQQTAMEERKRTEQRVKELKEERAREEIQNKLEAAGERRRVDRVDWMYQGPSAGQNGTTEEMEGYLLGKRRIDTLLEGKEKEKLAKGAEVGQFMALGGNANSARDLSQKVREDPMLAIKRQEQAAFEALMNDPVKRQRLMAIAAGGEEKSSKDRERKHRSHRHHHRHRDGSDDERRSKRRHTEGGDRGRDRDHDSRRHGESSRRRSRDRRSASPYHSRRRESRSKSPIRRRVSRSRSSDRRKPSRSRSPEPRRRDDRTRDKSRRSPVHKPHYQQTHTQYQNKSTSTPQQSTADKEAERAAKLAAMQADASTLDLDREKRLAAIAERDRADREADDLSRTKKARYGDRADFITNIHRKAGDMGLAERIGRTKQGLSLES